MKVLTTQSPLLVRLSLLTQSLFASLNSRGKGKSNGLSSGTSSEDSPEITNLDSGTAVIQPTISDPEVEITSGTSRGLQKTSPDSNGTGKRSTPSS